MFVTNCFLRNVSEDLWTDVTIIGYEPQYRTFKYNLQGKNLVLEGGTWHCTDSDNHPNCVDCGENKRLFISLALMRNDSDDLQWYNVNGDMRFVKAFDNETKELFAKQYGEDYVARKATKEEIINRFNLKE